MEERFEREAAGEREPPAAGSREAGKKESVARLKEELVAAVGARRDAERRLGLKDLPNRRRLEVRQPTVWEGWQGGVKNRPGRL